MAVTYDGLWVTSSLCVCVARWLTRHPRWGTKGDEILPSVLHTRMLMSPSCFHLKLGAGAPRGPAWPACRPLASRRTHSLQGAVLATLAFLCAGPLRSRPRTAVDLAPRPRRWLPSPAQHQHLAQISLPPGSLPSDSRPHPLLQASCLPAAFPGLIHPHDEAGPHTFPSSALAHRLACGKLHDDFLNDEWRWFSCSL